ncbi:MAG: hypothetical protein KatS3mg109_0058 [Pirellulaceae bacterium]|nr:MAG: hypothetical protein KatS3mg109_0058 [Pirellulaceae bacterium]
MPNPRFNATDLQVLRHYDGDGNLQRNMEMESAAESTFSDGVVPAGRVLSLSTNGKADLGVPGKQVPMWLFRRTDRPSGGWKGESPKTATGLTWSDGSVKQFLCFVGIEGLEVATTEFDSTRTYNYNDFVIAPDAVKAAALGWAADEAGRLTNEGVVHGAHSIVGVVSKKPGDYSRFNNSYLVVYTLYRPPVEGLLAGTPTNITP